MLLNKKLLFVVEISINNCAKYQLYIFRKKITKLFFLQFSRAYKRSPFEEKTIFFSIFLYTGALFVHNAITNIFSPSEDDTGDPGIYEK